MDHNLITDYDDGQANVWFSKCDNTETFEEDERFEVCQAGYKDRKLVFDNENQ